jgi:hypothetical protein
VPPACSLAHPTHTCTPISPSRCSACLQRHAGSKVVGEWSRFDLMTRPAEFGRASIPAVQAVLPPSAHSLYFRDSIGNISSSETRAGLDAVAVQLQPRYPLFGGWSNRFLFGWTLPLADVVAKVGWWVSGWMGGGCQCGVQVWDVDGWLTTSMAVEAPALCS